MKKLIFISSILVFTLVGFVSPQSEKLLKSKDFVWCGIDYSEVKCIGSHGFNEPDQIKNRYFAGWNNLIMLEPKKYDLKKFYKKDGQVEDFSVVNKRNEKPVIKELVIDEPYSFKEGQLEKIVKTYNLEKAKEGLGLVYVMESLDKNSQKATMHVVFFDIATKNILWTQKYVEPAGGFGFRNYWASPIYRTMRVSSSDFAKKLKSIK
ncbi:MAG: hypothetical protein ACK4ND_13105 [Cytophagaceae bacterium]